MNSVELVNSVEHKNCEIASAIKEGVRNVVDSLRVVLRHQSRTQGCAEANPGRVTRVTRIGANASGWTTARRNAKSDPSKITKVTRIGENVSGRTTDRRTSTYITGNSYVSNRQGEGKPKTNGNRYRMSNQVRIE